MSSPTPRIVPAECTDDFASTLRSLLRRFNTESSAWQYDGSPLGLHLLADGTGEIVGGLLGSTSYGYLHLDAVFVPEHLRRFGVGRRMIEMAEQEAIRRGCSGAWLDTFSFQARGFYEKLGYLEFGELPNNPPGHTRYFFRKVLNASTLP